MQSLLDKIKKFFGKINKNIIENIKTRRIIVIAFIISALIFAYSLVNYADLLAVYGLEKKVASEVQNMDIVIGGEAVGIKLLATGVLVMSVDREDLVNIQIGDIILKVNGIKIETNAELANHASISDGKELLLEIDRNGKKVVTSVKPIVDDITGQYRLGLWVKDSSAGVGTVTFYDKKNSKFAALGHAVTETRENYILPIQSGGITKTLIYSIKKGISKVPGELKGTLSTDVIGQIAGNTDKGIYGEISDESNLKNKKSVQIMPKSKIQEKEAKIYCTLDDNKVEEFNIVIEKVLLTSTGNKNMIIRITDERLKERTGGIVQGMSGSPIVQDGKLVGAVTHVFLNDPLRGYGVFVENMIEDMNSVE
ncbi:MAG: SpoIVB peptidase [Clostridia bacterium]|nr:SpoIVB peptidase [Clostridia bacterium]